MRSTSLVSWSPTFAIVASLSMATPLSRNLAAQGAPAVGGRQLFALDFASAPAGGLPTGIRVIRGKVTIASKDGAPALKAAEPAEFLVSLSEPLPEDFSIEFDLVPKACCNPEDVSFEGTPAISRSASSMHVVWHPETLIAVGGGEYVQIPMPEEIKETLPSQPTQVLASFQGTAFKLYTNGKLVLDLPNRKFVRGRVLRVFLGGQDDDLHAVYLSKLVITAGSVTVAAAGTPTGSTSAVLVQSGTTTQATGMTSAPATTSVTAPTSAGATTGPVTTTATSSPAAANTVSALDPGSMLVGTGMSDITGPIAEVGMMGYGKFSQQTSGLHTRLYARAFIFAAPNGGKRVVFVSTELAMLFSSVKQGVLKRLAAQFGTLYDDRNVMISATHTHAGPGGFSHHAMYNLTTYGHIKQNYDAIVTGITEAIVQAHNRLAPGTVSVMSGEVAEATMVNRSIEAFRLDAEAKATPRPDTVNREMTVLKVLSGGKPIGSIAWFAVHNTSMSQDNHYVSSDHKGYAAYLFEKQFGSIAPLQNYGDFVAAFPNGAEGDMSPNLDTSRDSIFYGPGHNEFESTTIIGQREFAAAYSLFTNAGQTPLTNEIDFRHAFMMMPGLPVPSSKFTNGVGLKTLCVAAYGASFMAGAEDGPTFTLKEGLALGSTMDFAALTTARAVVTGLVSALMPPLGPPVAAAMAGSSDQCQMPKPVLIPTGELHFTPDILPFQILRIGPVAIAGIPGEMTMQAGRRLQANLKAALAPLGVQRVILTGLANEYSGYITTPEEYDSQQYEGASTLYGRLTFDAYQEQFSRLASAMAAGQAVDGGPTPPDLSVGQIELQYGVVRDEVPAGETFGQMLLQPPATVSRGTSVQIVYRSGHPKNDLRRNNTYFRIERDLGGGNWALAAWDATPDTRMHWARATEPGIGQTCPGTPCYWSTTGVVWYVPQDATPGTYRIRVVGSWKNGATGELVRYEGRTNTFIVQ